MDLICDETYIGTSDDWAMVYAGDVLLRTKEASGKRAHTIHHKQLLRPKGLRSIRTHQVCACGV